MGGDRGKSIRVGKRVFAVLAAPWIAGLIIWACGGTTGESDLAMTAPQTVADATVAAADAGSDVDSGLFDVAIQYADRPLPDVSASAATGSDGGWDSGLPNCPPWIAIGSDGGMIPLSTDPTQPVDMTAYENIDHFTPSEYGTNGEIEPAPEGSECATYPYYSNVSNNCLQQKAGTTDSYPYSLFPPCGWALNLGNAVAGPGAGRPRYQLCIELYNCIEKSRCFDPAVTAGAGEAFCFCGYTDAGGCSATPPAPSGPCVPQVQAAFEQAALGSPNVLQIIDNYIQQYSPGPQETPQAYGSTLFQIYAEAVAFHCIPAAQDN